MKKVLWDCLLFSGLVLNWSMVFAADVYVESSGSCGGKTPCYSTIQAAINAANSGDTIKLAQGIYPETFVLSSGKQLITQGGWDAEFKNQTPRTTSIRAPVVPNGAIAFQELRIMEIAGPMGNATIADVLDGKTFSSDTGTGLTGSMPNRGGMNYTPTTTDQTIAAGYYNGSGKVEGDSNLTAPNIVSGKSIFGVAGSAVVAIGDAVKADVLATKTFSNSSSAGLTGTMADREGDNASTAQAQSGSVNYFTAPEGYYDGDDRVSATDAQVAALDTEISAGNIRSTVTIFGVTGDTNVVDTSSGDASSGDILKDKKAWVNGSELSGTRYSGCTCTGTLYENRWCDNGNGTVTDLTTCLVWLQKADWGGVKPWRNSSTDCSPLSYTCYDDAHTRASILHAGTSGANLSDGSVEGDWRLPTKTELAGLVNGTPNLRCTSGPCDLYGFTGLQSYYYWSSTTYASKPYRAWYVGMIDGDVGDDTKDLNLLEVWPVRSDMCGETGTAANDEIAKTDLRNFSTEEVTYHGVNGTYAGVLADLLPGFSPDENVTVTIEGADSLGFCATAVHSNGTGPFYLGYGVRPATCTSEPVNYIEGGGEIVKLGPATDGCLAVAAQEIQTIRSQIALYKIQHNDNAPGRGGTYTSTSEMKFFPDGTLSDPSQMVIKTDVNGNPGADFGPYWAYEWVTQALFLYLSEMTGEVEMVSSGCAE